MARSRRNTGSSMRRSLTGFNLEILGIAAFGFALLLGLALSFPASSGQLGASTAHALHVLFGATAWLFPMLIAVIGTIIFIEIDVPRLMAKYGMASCCYFGVLLTAFGSAGGVCGTALREVLISLVGPPGAILTLFIAAVVTTVAMTDVSVKRLIGWCVLTYREHRQEWLAYFEQLEKGRRKKAKLAAQDPAPKTLSEAFHLVPTASSGKKSALATVIPATGAVAVGAAAAAAGKSVVQGHEEAEDEEDEYEDEEEEYEEEESEEEGDDEEESEEEGDDEEDADEDDEEYDEEDEEYEDDEEDEEYEDDDEEELEDEKEESKEKGTAVVGEYELPATVGAPARVYRLPDLSLFDPPQAQKIDETSRAGLLEDTLGSFGVTAKVVHIERGPSITRYELKPDRGVKISRISALADDIALALAATSVRIEAPIPGKSAVGIEVPNAQVSVVAISEILNFLPQRGTVPPLNMALGKDITGRPVFGDLGRMPHLLVAGATGSGKSVCLNGIIASLLASATPDQVQLLMIDPKRVELTEYNGIPHHIKDVITDARMAAGALYEMTREMDTRYERFAKVGVRKIEEYNAKFPDEKLPYVVIVIDELADLMLIAPAKVETTICRIAQLARATGIHLIVATQRPSVDVITGIIKANIPSRIAFAVSSQVDSRTILDMVGAERLLGRGDMLFLPIDAPKPVRAQGALITGQEVNRLVEFWAAQARPDNLLDVEVTPIDEDDKQRNVDALCYDAAKFIIESGMASTAQLQSRFSIGHPRAVRIMKQLEEFGIVGPHEGTKARRINIGIGELETIADRLTQGKNGKDGQIDLFTAST
jgi:S-DNA-T family DNA segregation ATPase FtsK/SpoIIIE